MAIMASAIVVAGCTGEDINEMIQEQVEEEIRNQTVGRVEQIIQDVQESVNDLLNGGSGDDEGIDATGRPTADPEVTPVPGVITPTPTPAPLTDADNAIHVTATLEVWVVDQNGNPIPDKMVYFNGISWIDKDPNEIMLEKRTGSDGKASFTIGYNLINNKEKFTRLGSPNYVDYLAMGATTVDVRYSDRGNIKTYIDRYWTDHWTVITYPQASAQAGDLKYAAITKRLKLWVMDNGKEYGSPQN